jgi:hypothetical protein
LARSSYKDSIKNILYFSELYFIFYTFSKFIHISQIIKPEKKFKKDRNNAESGFGPAGKASWLAHARGTTWAHPCVVSAHCRRAVAWSVQLTGGLSGDKVFTLVTGELHGDCQGRLR